MEYYIYITNDCNMGCSYCSVLFDTNKFGIPKTPQYSFDELEKFITLIQEQLDDKVADIYFFGGEPTMNYNAISNLIEAMNKPHKYEINYIMHTNALRLKQAPNDILKNISLTVLSVNYELIYKQNHLTDYFDIISKAVKHLKSKNNSPIIGRFTISPKTSLYSECCLLVNVFDYIYWQIDNCDSFPSSTDYIRQYKSDVERLWEYWLSFLRVGVFLNFVPFITALSRYISDTSIPTEYYCGYGNSMIYVQTDGKCYACCDSIASETHLIGNISEGISFPKIDILQSICGGCSYIKICGGRCGRMHREFSEEHIKEYCNMNKFMFDIIKTSLPEIVKLIEKYPNYKTKINNPIFAYTEYTA